ncbi:MAG: aminotransferase class V-fold PLP-dependent enzyme [Gemmatimonadetes bacterium]|nr:aminotransferase class V-fold PLP-dependent enzyme [Gemmatimonadota bacterium]
MTAAPPAPDLARYRDEFPIFRHAIYLNSCSLGALAQRTRVALGEYLDQWERRGASAWYDTWLPAAERLRAGYGRVVGADTENVSLHPSITSALTVVAESLDYRERPKVITTSLDFPTVAYQWLAKAARGVELVVLESPDGVTVPLELFAGAIDHRTALVATSHVFFTSGAIQDLPALAALCHANGALLLVDGYQGAGQLPVDVSALGADFYCAGGLKWLLGGSGIAFLAVRPGLARRLEPAVAGWFGHAEPFRFDPRRLDRADDARRFDLGTPSVASLYAQLAGLSVLEEIGLPAVRAATQALTEDLIDAAREHALRPRVAPGAADRSAIVMIPRADPHADVRRLAERGFIVDARPGHVRISPYFYNLPGDHRACLECLARGT